MIVGMLVLRPSASSSSGSVATDIGGSCFVYNADRSQVDHTVDCNGPHDATVTGYADDETKCPAGTDAVLTTSTDTNGRDGVLCVHENH
jgi:hypothetical protein